MPSLNAKHDHGLDVLEMVGNSSKYIPPSGETYGDYTMDRIR